MYMASANGGLCFNKTFFFNNAGHGRFVARHHMDDWDGVMYEGAEVEMENRHQVEYMLACNSTANSEFLLLEPESHLALDTSKCFFFCLFCFVNWRLQSSDICIYIYINACLCLDV